MKRYGGAIAIPHRTCKTLGEIAEGRGERLTAREIARRKAIEEAHGNDDGTLIHWHREHGELCKYDAPLTDISDRDPVAILIAFGLSQRNANLLERNGCEEIADVRSALLCGEIPTWDMCSTGVEQQIREAVERMDDGH